MSGIPLRLILALLLALGCAGPALAQRWNIDSSVETQATLTNNANYDVGAQSEGDLIFNVRPAVSFSREGSRLRVAGAASLNAVWYVDGVQTNRVLPQANILANLEAIDQLFFIEAALVANQSVLNPFLPTSAADSTFNKYTYVQGRISPYLEGNVGNNWRYLVRSDNSYTYSTQTDSQLDNSYYGQHVAQVVRIARPLGGSLRVQSNVTRFYDQRDEADQTLDTALATVNYAFTPQFSAGLRGGYERTNYTRIEESGPIYGAELAWSPGPQTRIAGFWESRFFGPSYDFGASTRLRRFATNLSAFTLCGDQPTTHTAAASDRQCFGLAGCDPDRAFPGSGRTRTTGAGSDQSPVASIGASGRGQYLFAKRQCIYLGLWHVCLDRCAQHVGAKSLLPED